MLTIMAAFAQLERDTIVERNPATHSTDELPRQETLEPLATLSILARWIDRCGSVTV
jgi:hypothetical protein